jgi:hypothetical protein
VPTFTDRGCYVISVTDPYDRIEGFLGRESRGKKQKEFSLLGLWRTVQSLVRTKGLDLQAHATLTEHRILLTDSESRLIPVRDSDDVTWQ